MSEVGNVSPPLRFFILSCRDPKTDFRRPLAESLRDRHETYYVFLKRRPLVEGPDIGSIPEEMSFPAFVSWLRRTARGDAENVYFNSTNLVFPVLMPFLRLAAPGGIWCLDMHDDLLYDTAGLQRLRGAAAVQVQNAFSHITVRAADSLVELFPNSKPLGNASHIEPVHRPALDARRILILASLDQRFDFHLTTAVAKLCPSTTFHIHGQISRDDPAIRVRLENLLAGAPNIIYHGAYTMAALDGILRSYSVSLAPYRMDSRLTRYIDPLRFYHCLNSGLELITTPIPQAEAMQHCLHLVRSAEDCASVIREQPFIRRNIERNYQPLYWRERADQLVGLLTQLRGGRQDAAPLSGDYLSDRDQPGFGGCSPSK
jgi:hypothetical protein